MAYTSALREIISSTAEDALSTLQEIKTEFDDGNIGPEKVLKLTRQLFLSLFLLALARGVKIDSIRFLFQGDSPSIAINWSIPKKNDGGEA